MPTVTLRQLAERSLDETIQDFLKVANTDTLELDEETILRFHDIRKFGARVVSKGINEYLKADDALHAKFKEQLEILNAAKWDGLNSWKEMGLPPDERLRLYAELTERNKKALVEAKASIRREQAKALLEAMTHDYKQEA